MTNYNPRFDFAFSVRFGVSPYLHDEIPEFDPPLARYEEALHALYHACVDALTPPEPREITERSQVSAWMVAWGAPDIGRELGRSVQRYRDAAKADAVNALREVLLSIKQTRTKSTVPKLEKVA